MANVDRMRTKWSPDAPVEHRKSRDFTTRYVSVDNELDKRVLFILFHNKIRHSYGQGIYLRATFLLFNIFLAMTACNTSV